MNQQPRFPNFPHRPPSVPRHHLPRFSPSENPYSFRANRPSLGGNLSSATLPGSTSFSSGNGLLHVSRRELLQSQISSKFLTPYPNTPYDGNRELERPFSKPLLDTGPTFSNSSRASFPVGGDVTDVYINSEPRRQPFSQDESCKRMPRSNSTNLFPIVSENTEYDDEDYRDSSNSRQRFGIGKNSPNIHSNSSTSPVNNFSNTRIRNSTRLCPDNPAFRRNELDCGSSSSVLPQNVESREEQDNFFHGNVNFKGDQQFQNENSILDEMKRLQSILEKQRQMRVLDEQLSLVSNMNRHVFEHNPANMSKTLDSSVHMDISPVSDESINRDHFSKSSRNTSTASPLLSFTPPPPQDALSRLNKKCDNKKDTLISVNDSCDKESVESVQDSRRPVLIANSPIFEEKPVQNTWFNGVTEAESQIENFAESKDAIHVSQKEVVQSKVLDNSQSSPKETSPRQQDSVFSSSLWDKNTAEKSPDGSQTDDLPIAPITKDSLNTDGIADSCNNLDQVALVDKALSNLKDLPFFSNVSKSLLPNSDAMPAYCTSSESALDFKEHTELSNPERIPGIVGSLKNEKLQDELSSGGCDDSAKSDAARKEALDKNLASSTGGIPGCDWPSYSIPFLGETSEPDSHLSLGVDTSNTNTRSQVQVTNSSHENDVSKAGSLEKVVSTLEHALDDLGVSDPVVGLNYIIEYRKSVSVSGRFSFHCKLCNTSILRTKILDHVLGSKHRLKYLKTMDETCYEYIMLESPFERDAKIYEECVAMEKKYGRGSVVIETESPLKDTIRVPQIKMQSSSEDHLMSVDFEPINKADPPDAVTVKCESGNLNDMALDGDSQSENTSHRDIKAGLKPLFESEQSDKNPISTFPNFSVISNVSENQMDSYPIIPKKPNSEMHSNDAKASSECNEEFLRANSSPSLKRTVSPLLTEACKKVKLEQPDISLDEYSHKTQVKLPVSGQEHGDYGEVFEILSKCEISSDEEADVVLRTLEVLVKLLLRYKLKNVENSNLEDLLSSLHSPSAEKLRDILDLVRGSDLSSDERYSASMKLFDCTNKQKENFDRVSVPSMTSENPASNLNSLKATADQALATSAETPPVGKSESVPLSSNSSHASDSAWMQPFYCWPNTAATNSTMSQAAAATSDAEQAASWPQMYQQYYHQSDSQLQYGQYMIAASAMTVVPPAMMVGSDSKPAPPLPPMEKVAPPPPPPPPPLPPPMKGSPLPPPPPMKGSSLTQPLQPPHYPHSSSAPQSFPGKRQGLLPPPPPPPSMQKHSLPVQERRFPPPLPRMAPPPLPMDEGGPPPPPMQFPRGPFRAPMQNMPQRPPMPHFAARSYMNMP